MKEADSSLHPLTLYKKWKPVVVGYSKRTPKADWAGFNHTPLSLLTVSLLPNHHPPSRSYGPCSEMASQMVFIPIYLIVGLSLEIPNHGSALSWKRKSGETQHLKPADQRPGSLTGSWEEIPSMEEGSPEGASSILLAVHWGRDNTSSVWPEWLQ